MSTQLRVLYGSLCALFLFCAGESQATEIKGEVRFGWAPDNAFVVGIPSRNLYALDSKTLESLPIVPIQAGTADFSLTTPDWPNAYLMVVYNCSPAMMQQGRWDQCNLRFPHLLPVRDGQSVVLEVPDENPIHQQESLWTDADRRNIRLGGYVLLALLLFLAWWLRRRAPVPHHQVKQSGGSGWQRWIESLFLLLALSVFSVGLDTEALGLLEYTYFQEGMRPAHSLDILSDPISTELAHGPIFPLLLRWVSQISLEAWALRCPSILFAALSVYLVVRVMKRQLGANAAMVAGALMLTNPLVVHYARDATPYALTALCAVLSVWLLLQTGRRRQWFFWCALALCQWIGFFSHYGYSFLALALFVGCCAAWWRNEPNRLSKALITFAVAAVPVVWASPRLLDVLHISGIRFALMSPIYPVDPGLGAYLGHFLTLLSGFMTGWQWMLILVLPLWFIGVRILWKNSRFLAALSIVQLLFLVCFVVFNHAMYTSHGGGRVFFAFRYATPLVLSMVLPLAASVASKMKWVTWSLVALSAISSAPLWMGPTRPAQKKAVETISRSAQPGDAYAILPASFYGDPLQYYLKGENPDTLITYGRASTITLEKASLWGPLVEGRMPLPTQVAHMGHPRLWVVAYREEMFGVPKFDPAVIESTLSQISEECGPPIQSLDFPLIQVFQYDCPSNRIWKEKKTLTLDFSNAFQLDRWTVRSSSSQHRSSINAQNIHLPEDCQSVEIYATGSDIHANSLHLWAANQRGAPVFRTENNGVGIWTLDLRTSPEQKYLSITPNNESLNIDRVVYRR